MRRVGANAVAEAYENGYERMALMVMAAGRHGQAAYRLAAQRARTRPGPRAVRRGQSCETGILRTIEDRVRVS